MEITSKLESTKEQDFSASNSLFTDADYKGTVVVVTPESED